MNTENESDILQELNNDTYISKIQTLKNKKLRDKEIEIEQKNDKRKLIAEIQQQKLDDIKKNKLVKNDNENYTEIHGKTKLENLNTIKQYQLLFSDQLADFKYKKSSTNEQLVEIINEIKAIVEISTVDNFILSSVYDCILMIEPYTKVSRYNLEGLTNVLKMNPMFSNLAKQVLLKYNMMSGASCELQLIIVLSTSIYMTIQKNNSSTRKNMDQFLNEKI